MRKNIINKQKETATWLMSKQQGEAVGFKKK